MACDEILLSKAMGEVVDEPQVNEVVCEKYVAFSID